jgi:hypothetical protein
MGTWTLLIVIITGSVTFSSSGFPYKVDTIVERGFKTETLCKEAAADYKALESVKVPIGRIQVSWKCHNNDR